jgi:hypothetical protein
MGTGVPETRFRGRSQASLYDTKHLHQGLDNRTPMAVWCEGTSESLTDNAVDMMDKQKRCPHAHNVDISSRSAAVRLQRLMLRPFITFPGPSMKAYQILSEILEIQPHTGDSWC